jgi:hypothetical protein
VYDVHTTHTIRINASANRVYNASRKFDLSCSPVIRILFFLRSLPALLWSVKKSKTNSLGNTLDGLLSNGFILLEENPPNEIVLGLVGKFWTLSGCIQRMTPDALAAFNDAGYAKAVWNFHLEEQADGSTLLSTETRVQCTDDVSRKKFLRYWFIVGPFSGLIRKEMLRTIKQQAESV